MKDAVYELMGIFLPWKLLLNGDIELLNHIISACQNCSVRKPVLILEVLLKQAQQLLHPLLQSCLANPVMSCQEHGKHFCDLW
ncbi:hypothetical protein TNIN_173531 [Trichonephila inaurata madagascariensis]|uniref:Uncharacterized protein n=1 Tax=Trichonephila inaurata madagascariensis TaxID=2747483 RepID=A0A8X6YIK9_9ARAC|nr:hypothetical protein TNIN_173531 [Trichonephila inaurata madagascariensis]